MHDKPPHEWRHPSVTRFAEGGDPIGLMLNKASSVALNAMQEGWAGPPFDPFALAELLNVNVIPNSDLLDARTVPIGADRMRIEYNPNRTRARIRYSIAHEIAHTFFPDAAKQVRNRAARHEYDEDDWELEMLCNLGAAELLMPTGSLADLQNRRLSIADVMELRKKYEVSTESVLLRLARVTHEPYVVFVASRGGETNDRYKIDYSIMSRANPKKLARNVILPKETIVRACTAIGYTAAADENWPGIGAVHLECVGIYPYPECVHPRVAGLLRATEAKSSSTGGIQFVTGDATVPLGHGARILAHIVNDATPNWGAGFGRVVQRKWPNVQHSFRESWQNSSRKRLGEVFSTSAEAELTICQMVCQNGYGASELPRVRYSALRDCLQELRDLALTQKASIHMPRIGTGEAGGSWALISALIDEVLCAAGLLVTVYDLPANSKVRRSQPGLFDKAL